MNFSEIGGMVSEIYELCSSKDEWFRLLSEDMKLLSLKLRYDMWLSSDKLSPLPFTKDEINYLNSPLIDALSKLKYNTNYIEVFLDACRDDNLIIADFIDNRFKLDEKTIRDGWLVANFNKKIKIIEWCKIKHNLEEFIVVATNYNFIRINDGLNYYVG